MATTFGSRLMAQQPKAPPTPAQRARAAAAKRAREAAKRAAQEATDLARVVPEPEMVETIDIDVPEEPAAATLTTPPTGDVVEVIGDGPAQPSAASPPTAAVSDAFQFRGFVRTTGIGLLAISPPAVDASPFERVPLDRFQVWQHVYLGTRYRRDNFEVSVSGLMNYSVHAQENQPFAPGEPFTPLSIDARRFEAQLRDAFVGVYSRRFDFRLGLQRLAWGNSDAFAVNDVLNARDLRERLFTDAEIIHIPTLMARGDVDLDVGVLQLVASPIFTTDRFDVYGSNWAIVQPGGPSAYKRLFGILASGADQGTVDVIQNDIRTVSRPKDNLTGGSAGGAFKWKFRGGDVSHYYHYGFDRSPSFFLDPSFADQLANLDRDQFRISALVQEYQRRVDAGETPFTLGYVRRHHFGSDVQATAGPFLLRADAAVSTATVLYSARSLNSITAPTAQGVLGIEYQTGTTEKVILLEGWYQRVLEDVNERLLFYERDSFALAALMRWKLIGKTLVELRAFGGMKPTTFAVRPEVGWASESFSIRLGGQILGGEQGSFGHYFRRNMSAYLTARYSF